MAAIYKRELKGYFNTKFVYQEIFEKCSGNYLERV